MEQAHNAFVISISGASSSGKTTLSRLLRDIFPNTFILHQDDFYRPDEEIPIKDGLQDWDCADALDLPAITESLQHIRRSGTFWSAKESKEDLNVANAILVPQKTVDALKAKVDAWTTPGQPGDFLHKKSLCLYEGFLIYSHSTSEVWPYLDLKIFLQVSHAAAKTRREERSGYVTIDGLWEDPPGYVDNIVWPNYCHDHRWLFENNDVEGKLKEDVEGLNEIQWPKKIDLDIEKVLIWAVDLLIRELPNLVAKSS